MCLCIHETKCLSKREKANQIGNHCTHTHTERKKKISFLRVLSVDTQSVASTTSSLRRLGKASVASDTNQLLLLFLRRPISNAIRLIAVVVESDFCGYPQLQSKGHTFTTYRHTSYSYIRIGSYKAIQTHTQDRNNKIQRKKRNCSQ